MEKNKKYYLFFFILFIFFEFFQSESLTNEDTKFLSLKNNEVNLRLGPSFEYPIKLTYKKKILTYYNFRYIGCLEENKRF